MTTDPPTFCGSTVSNETEGLPSTPASESTPNAALIEVLTIIFGGQSFIARKAFVVLHQYVGGHMTTNLTILLIVVGCVWVVFNLLKQAKRTYYRSSIELASSDESYTFVFHWIGKNLNTRNSRHLVAETFTPEPRKDPRFLDSLKHNKDYIDFSVVPKRSVRYTLPFNTFCTMRHTGTSFEFWRHQTQVSDLFGSNTRETLVIYCYGRHTKPIIELITAARDSYYKDSEDKTHVFTPQPPSNRRRFDALEKPWCPLPPQQKRSINSVVHEDFDKILLDMNSHLSEERRTWCKKHCIPWKRGYLFHGPPGTGKSSAGLAVAAVFNLPVYTVDLGDGSISNEFLCALFRALPQDCIVMLEDIEGSLKRTQTANETDEQTKGVSLSGVLNAVDGVGSQEGRILIVTSNRPDTLDDALLRPGRIDWKQEFPKATCAQANKLFSGFFGNELRSPFSSKIQDYQLSHAEIQDFLLSIQQVPDQADEQLTEWLKQREKARVGLISYTKETRPEVLSGPEPEAVNT